MKPIYGVYDKSLRGGKYLLFFSESVGDVASRAYHLLIGGATEPFRHELAKGVRWPTLHGGLVIVDAEWACVYRFVEARDLSVSPRPLNVILMALVKRGEIVGKDWRGILTCTAFHDLAEFMKQGDRRCPESCARDVVLAEWSPQEGVVTALEAGASLQEFDAGAVCAAVPRMSPERHANLVVSDLRGSERLWLHAERPANRLARPAKSRNGEASTASGGGGVVPVRGRTEGASTERADYSAAWRQLRNLAVFVGVPAAIVIGVLVVWPEQVVEPLFRSGQWYELLEYSDGQRIVYDLVEVSELSPSAFEVRSRNGDDPVELVSKTGEKRLVPVQLLLPRVSPVRTPANRARRRSRHEPVQASPPTPPPVVVEPGGGLGVQ